MSGTSSGHTVREDYYSGSLHSLTFDVFVSGIDSPGKEANLKQLCRPAPSQDGMYQGGMYDGETDPLL